MSDRHAVVSDELVTYLRSNPRMIGVLATIMLLLTSAGDAAAANGGCIG